jgi:selenocysteine lyase/cysteine desulfurase
MTGSLLSVVGGDLTVPLIGGGEIGYVNLDYAASAPALVSVAERVTELLPFYASVHRGSGYASQVSTAVYESARQTVGEFVGARTDDTVLFTRNTTDSLNLLASVTPGRTLLLDTEHHANLLPWQRSAGTATVLRAEPSIAATLERLEQELAGGYALVTVTGASNVTGERLPLADIAAIAHAAGARLAVDGAQLVPHRRVDMIASGIDYLAFSGHKTYAPFGAGALIGRTDWLDAGRPYLAGGGAVSRVTLDETAWHVGPARHESGSPNVVGVAAMARAVEALAELDERAWVDHERALRIRLHDGLAALDRVTLHRAFSDSDDPVGVVTFTIEGAEAGLVSAYLSAEWGIAVRDGRFCAHPLLDRLGITAPAIRASVGLGSSAADVDRLLEALAGFLDSGPQWSYQLGTEGWEPADDSRPRPAWAPKAGSSSHSFGCSF